MDRDRFKKYTERARHVLSLAQEEAQRLNHNYLGSEHLLVGLVGEGEGVAGQVLASQSVTYPAASAALETYAPRQNHIVLGEIDLNEEAKLVLLDASMAATQFNHQHIGTEHLLIGLVARENVAVRLLQSLGVAPETLRSFTVTKKQSVPLTASPDQEDAETSDQMRATAQHLREQAACLELKADRIAGITPLAMASGRSLASTLRNSALLSPGISVILAFATEEARRFQHQYIGTEHLLLGVVRQKDGLTATILAGLEVDLRRVRRAVEFIIGHGDRIVLGDVGLTPRAKKVIEIALDEARLLGQQQVESEHLLLALIREGEGIAAGVLESMGVSLERARQATIAAIAQRDAGLPDGAGE